MKEEKKKRTHKRDVSRFVPYKPGLSNVFGIDLIPQYGLCCDASVTGGNPGNSEYQILDLNTKQIIKSYHIGHATNNLAEFYAIVNSIWIALQTQKYTAIYTDSQIALGWFYRKQINTDFDVSLNKTVRQLNANCIKILDPLDIKYGAAKWHFIINERIDLMFWNKHKWGENPADYGRK